MLDVSANLHSHAANGITAHLQFGRKPLHDPKWMRQMGSNPLILPCFRLLPC